MNRFEPTAVRPRTLTPIVATTTPTAEPDAQAHHGLP